MTAGRAIARVRKKISNIEQGISNVEGMEMNIPGTGPGVNLLVGAWWRWRG